MPSTRVAPIVTGAGVVLTGLLARRMLADDVRGRSSRGMPGYTVWPVVIAAAVGLSRLYLGVHWLTDVVAGWVFAVGWSAIPQLITPPAHTPTPIRGEGDRSS